MGEWILVIIFSTWTSIFRSIALMEAIEWTRHWEYWGKKCESCPSRPYSTGIDIVNQIIKLINITFNFEKCCQIEVAAKVLWKLRMRAFETDIVTREWLRQDPKSTADTGSNICKGPVAWKSALSQCSWCREEEWQLEMKSGLRGKGRLDHAGFWVRARAYVFILRAMRSHCQILSGEVEWKWRVISDSY